MDKAINITCYLVDDEFHSIEMLKDYIESTPGLELFGFATNPLDALNEVVCALPPVLTFVDVDMPELSGMEFAGMVSLHTLVIFTTSYSEYAIEAFEKNAMDYLLKPISYPRFLKSINKVKKYLLETSGGGPAGLDYFFITSEIKGKMIRIVVPEILFIQAAQNYIEIISISGKHMAYLTMEEIVKKIPAGRFVRVHRSFIINTEKIKTLEHGRLILEDNTVISLGRTYKDEFLALMKDRLLQSKRKTDS